MNGGEDEGEGRLIGVERGNLQKELWPHLQKAHFPFFDMSDSRPGGATHELFFLTQLESTAPQTILQKNIIPTT